MQWRIAVPYTVLIGLCLLGLGAYLATVLRQLQLDQLETQLAAEARLVGEVVAPVFGTPATGSEDRAGSAGGTGLGLAIAKHVIQALNGRIWAESETGRGTAVRFTLPIVSRGLSFSTPASSLTA
jgi:hypothetical protein